MKVQKIQTLGDARKQRMMDDARMWAREEAREAKEAAKQAAKKEKADFTRHTLQSYPEIGVLNTVRGQRYYAMINGYDVITSDLMDLIKKVRAAR